MEWKEKRCGKICITISYMLTSESIVPKTMMSPPTPVHSRMEVGTHKRGLYHGYTKSGEIT